MEMGKRGVRMGESGDCLVSCMHKTLLCGELEKDPRFVGKED